MAIFAAMDPHKCTHWTCVCCVRTVELTELCIPDLLLEHTLWYSKALQAAFETMPRMSRILKAETNAGDCWLSVSSTAHAEFCHLRLSATSKVHSE